MAEGIEFLIDIEAKLDGVIAANSAMRKFIESGDKADKAAGHAAHSMHGLADASDKAGHAHDRHAHGLVNLGHQFEYAKNGVNEFLEAIGLILVFEGFEKLIDKVKELGEEVLKAGAKAERMELSFASVFGKEKGAELLEFAEKFSKSTEFTREQSKEFELQLGRAGVSAEIVPRAMRAASDLALGFKDPVEGMNSVIHAFSTLTAGGMLGKRQFMSMGIRMENAPEKFFKEYSKRTGKGVVQLKKEMEAGKPMIEDAMESLFTLIAGDRGLIGPQGLAAGKTLGAKIAHFQEIPDALYEGVQASPGYEKLKGVLDDVANRFDPKTDVGKKLVDSLSLGLVGFSDALSKVDMKKFTDSVIKLFESLPALIQASTDALMVFGKVLNWLASGNELPTAAKIMKHLNRGDLLETVASHPVEALNVAGKGTGGRLVGFAQWFNQRLLDVVTVGRLTDHLGITGKAAGKSMMDGAAAGIDQHADKAAGAAGEAMEGTVEAGKKALNSNSPSRKFMQLGVWSAEGYEEGLTRHQPSLATRGYMEDALSIAAPSIGAGSLLSGMQPGGVAPRNVTVSAPINVSVSGSDATPEAIAEAIEMRVPSAILSALEQMALEGGQD